MIFNWLNKKRSQNISFIFGCPRGGTTWLWSLLESHEDVLPFVNEEKGENGKYVTSESGIYVRNPNGAKGVILDFCRRHPNKTIIEKTPLHTLKYEKILSDFPKSKHLVILRNPLAIANSMIQSEMEAFASHDVEVSIAEIKKYFAALEKLCSLGHLCITYEKLLSDTEFVMSQVLDYYGLSDSNLLKIVEENRGRTKVSVKGAFRSGRADSYLTELTDGQKANLTLKLGKEIAFYNAQL